MSWNEPSCPEEAEAIYDIERAEAEEQEYLEAEAAAKEDEDRIRDEETD